MRAWALLGLAAAAVVLGLAAGSLLPGTPAAEATPPLRWHVEAQQLADGGGYLREGQPWVGQVPVGRLYVRELTATLTWQDDEPGTAPDDFTLELVPPSPLPAFEQVEGSSGTLEQGYTVWREPPGAPSTLGRGAWTVRVYLRDAGDGTTLGVLPGQPDPGNSFHLSVGADAWFPD
jgi:hypothetical protein